MQISDNPPSRVGVLPLRVGVLPSSVGDFPSSVGDFPSSVGDFPSSVGTLPSSVGALPSSVGAIPTSVGDFPSDNFIKKYHFGECKYGYFCLHLCCLGHIRGDFFFSVACCRVVRCLYYHTDGYVYSVVDDSTSIYLCQQLFPAGYDVIHRKSLYTHERLLGKCLPHCFVAHQFVESFG